MNIPGLFHGILLLVKLCSWILKSVPSSSYIQAIKDSPVNRGVSRYQVDRSLIVYDVICMDWINASN
jgi:hypothetical protein